VTSRGDSFDGHSLEDISIEVVMECLKEQNLKDCGCTILALARGCAASACGITGQGRDTGVFLPRDGEKTYDRSLLNLFGS